MIKCKKCGIEKEEGEFYWDVKDARRMRYCKKCRRAQQKAYGQTKKGKEAQKKADKKRAGTNKRKASTAKHAKTAKRRASQAKHSKTDKRKASRAEWDKTDKGRANQARKDTARRAKKLAEINTLTPEQWKQILSGQGHECNGCHAPFTKEKPATEDHIIPLGEGPGRTEGNIQALCASCNSIKGPRSMEYLLEKLKEQKKEE